jgi:hypothetical protein
MLAFHRTEQRISAPGFVGWRQRRPDAALRLVRQGKWLSEDAAVELVRDSHVMQRGYDPEPANQSFEETSNPASCCKQS